ncbi:CDT1-like protein a, chloroplastic [Gastrolobium bilobum]|uniref:CDT1-like protein a, chloroplastic n=1 Tax=Gastrolobium bilobum TaxID=150636 RepID=UPI002AB23006|nr:CDT1-like protein a, chloroplastic [Gastrolobium bilobum]
MPFYIRRYLNVLIFPPFRVTTELTQKPSLGFPSNPAITVRMDKKDCEEFAKSASDFKCEESAKNASDVNCRKLLHAVDAPIACPTPEKNFEPLLIKSKQAETQLPEKCRTIADLFSHMSCSLRLLHLRKKSPTFQNISKQVEVLGKRKFSHAHLAQMKYILPEGIHIDKVLVHDKKSLCMKPDMKITLIFEVVEEYSKEFADMALRQYFCSRLIDFFNMHPEAPDIPEAILPEPFSQRTHSLICEALPLNSSTELPSTSNQIELLPEKLHLYPSFRRHFSRKNVADQTGKHQCFSPTKTSLSSHVSDCLDNQRSESTWQKECAPLPDCVTNLNTERRQQKESFSMCYQPGVINTPVHKICPPHSVCCSSSKSPDMKIVSCADSLMIETPAQSAPGRLMPVSDVKLQNMTTQKSTSCPKSAKRVLHFSLLEGCDGLDIRLDKLESSRAPDEFVSIPESSRGCSENSNSFVPVALPQEVKESLGYSFEKTNQNLAGVDAGNKKISSLLDYVNVIHSIFHSDKRTSITKEELLQKIIMNSSDFVEISEVEEQIEFLEKLVPDWICKKLVSSGDIIYWWVNFCLLLIRSLCFYSISIFYGCEHI